MKYSLYAPVFFVVLLLITAAQAQDRVVVVPLGSKKEINPIGDATPADVVEGKTFSNSSAAGLIGTRSPGIPAATGQTLCYDASGNPIDCAGTGQDGNLLKGAAVTTRFVDNGEGTVTDKLTGLIWLQNSTCAAFFSGDSTGQNARPWQDALDAANQLSSGYCDLGDGSTAGEWRLPNASELRSLIDYSRTGPALPAGHPFVGIDGLFNSWSSTSHAGNTGMAWLVYFFDGASGISNKSGSFNVLAVRSGQ